jgi:transcriptional regulator with XRE-family HTH domain
VENISSRFGKVLRQLRKTKRLSQEKLAELADLDRTFVSMIERGKRRPTLETAKKLANALGVPLASMVDAAERKRP